MTSISETPTKNARSNNYDSEADSGDDLFADMESHPTIPWKREVIPPQQDSMMSSYPAQLPRSTQPTQLLDAAGPNGEILVPHSSSPAPALRSSPPPVYKPRQLPSGGRLASVMAPPGTSFHMPLVQRAPAKAVPIIEVDDDDAMPYVGDSSDEEQARRNDIRPTVLKSKQPPSTSRSEQFHSLISKSYYGGSNGNMAKRPANSPVNSPKPAKAARQNGSSKAIAVDDEDSDLNIDDIEDYLERVRVSRMKNILPDKSIRQLRDALRLKRGRTDDAMDYLATLEESREPIDLTRASEDEDELSQSAFSAKPLAKQTLAKPSRTINQKYIEKRASTSTQQSRNLLSISDEQRPKKRLMRGRRLPSPPQSSSPVIKPTSKPVSREETPLQDSESSAPSEPESPVAATGDLLDFINKCSVLELIDLASITEQQAQLILGKRPFRNLTQVRNVHPDAPKSKSRKVARTLGEKVVDVCEEMFEGYEAIEQLLQRCESMAEPVKRELRRWGVDLAGAANEGSIGLVSLPENDLSTPKDSGMRTPVSLSHSADEEADVVTPLSKRKAVQKTFAQPSNLAEKVELKDYQKIGVEWLTLLFRSRLSCILADDMGLGKTCQVISFLARLMGMGEKGPHIIIVPASTLENWLREFQTFCPAMLVMPYYGSQAERLEIQAEIESSDPYALVTTYDTAKKKDDRKFLTRLRPAVCVFDEGHALKNSQTKVYGELMKLDCKFRLLLTGTPLQNNLQELCSLLGFILPQLFGEHEEQLQSIFRHKATTTAENTHDALLSKQRIDKARAMMAPFVLRRKKHQVLKDIPPKTLRVEYCDMTDNQKELYEQQLQKFKDEAANSKKAGKRENVLMTLRQAAIHPWLFRRLYDDGTLRNIASDYVKEFPESRYDLVLEDISIMTDSELHHMTTHNVEVSYFLSKYSLPGEPWMDSGKVEKLVSLLLDYRAAGDRVLLFSQFKLVLDILEYVLETIQVKFFRLDGDTRIEERQELLDEFYQKPEVTCFMLSTKAGGAGINLACANKVIIFDQSFNPQDDVQAENRAHRLGQTRPVEVIRLVTRNTIEEQILALGTTKLALDSRIAGEDGQDGKAHEKQDKEGQAKVREMLLSGNGAGETVQG